MGIWFFAAYYVAIVGLHTWFVLARKWPVFLALALLLLLSSWRGYHFFTHLSVF
jgi:hypothetical protein